MSYLNTFFKTKKCRQIFSDSSFSEKFSESMQSNQHSKDFSILEIPPHIIAIHLTVIDIQLFKKITPGELMACQWTKPKKMTLAPNISKMTHQFNNICYFIIDEILSRKTAKARSLVIRHFIKVAKKLFYLNNINSMKSVVSALQSSPVYRLKESFCLLNKKDRDRFQRYENVFSEANNRETLRAHLKSSKTPCIPYLGLFLTDLTYMDSMFPNNGEQNPERSRKMLVTINFIKYFQQSCYDFICTSNDLTQFFSEPRYIEECKKSTDERYYNLSVGLEPLNDLKNNSSASLSRVFYNSDSVGTTVRKEIISLREPSLSLVDGSPLLDTTSRSRVNSLAEPSPRNVKRPKCVNFLQNNPNNIVYEGCLKRSVLLKKGERLTSYDSKKLWVTLTLDKQLSHIQFSTPFLSCVGTTSVKYPFHKFIDMSNYYVLPISANKKGFLLISDKKDVIHKYVAKTAQESCEWLQHLSAITKIPNDMPLNLILLDDGDESSRDGS